MSFYRNETALSVQSYSNVTGSWIKGGHPLATRPDGVTVTGIYANGQHININGCRFGTDAFQCDIDIDLRDSGDRFARVEGNYFLGGAGSHPSEHVACVRMTHGGSGTSVAGNYFQLRGTATGIVSDTTTVHSGNNVTGNHVHIFNDGRFYRSNGSANAFVMADNVVFANGGLTLTRPVVDMPLGAAAYTAVYRDNTMRTANATLATFLSLDSRSSVVDGNTAGNTNVTLLAWINATPWVVVKHYGRNYGGPLTSARGRAAFAVGETTITVTHGVTTGGDQLTGVVLTPHTNEFMWVSARTATTFSVSRTASTGTTNVSWYAFHGI